MCSDKWVCQPLEGFYDLNIGKCAKRSKPPEMTSPGAALRIGAPASKKALSYSLSV